MNNFRIFLKIITVLVTMQVSLAYAQAENRPSSITFLDTVYSLAWGPDPNVRGWAAVYLPEGESLPNYTNMLRVEHNPKWSVTEAVQGQLQFLEQGSSNSGARILDLTENPNTGEVLLVFLFVMEEDEIAKWKWSAYRYMPIQTVDGKHEGARLFDHSRQYVGNDKEGIERFLAEVGDKKAKRINALTKLQIP